MPELTLDRITKHFKNKIAVDNVSLTLREGVYGFLGANGAGKTTLLRMVCGVLKPTAGEIRCNDMEIGRLDGDYRYLLGYLPQDFGRNTEEIFTSNVSRFRLAIMIVSLLDRKSVV